MKSFGIDKVDMPGFKLQSLDTAILLSVQRWRHHRINWFWVALTYSGTGKTWFITAAILTGLDLSGIQFAPKQFSFLRAMFAPLLAWMLSHALKRIIGRPRPSTAIEGFELFLPPPACRSFPSGHSAAAFAFFTALLLAGHPWAIFVGIWTPLVSFSRLYLGVHYLSDILGGVFFGAVSALILWQVGIF